MHKIAVQLDTQVQVNFLGALPEGTEFHESDDTGIKSYLELEMETKTKVGHLQPTHTDT